MTLTRRKQVEQKLDQLNERLNDVATKGYAVGLNVRGYIPEFQRATFSAEYLIQYTTKRYSALDPVFMWAMTQSGTARWSDVQKNPSFSLASDVVHRAASVYGLKYGAISAVRPFVGSSIMSFLSVARDDRELADDEVAEVEKHFRWLQKQVAGLGLLSEKERKVLHLISLGETQPQIADILGVSTPTIARIAKTCQEKLGTTNQVSSAVKAVKLGLIGNEGEDNWW